MSELIQKIQMAQRDAAEQVVIDDLRAKGLLPGEPAPVEVQNVINREPEVGTTGQTIDPQGVDHPKHYNVHPSGIEVIEIVRHMSFNVGSAFKYMARLGEKVEPGLTAKESKIKDLKKVVWYLADEIANFKSGTQMAVKPRNKLTTFMATENDFLTQQFYGAILGHAQDGDMDSLDYARSCANSKIEEVSASTDD